MIAQGKQGYGSAILLQSRNRIGQIPVYGVGQVEFAPLHKVGQQCSGERFANGANLEQIVGGGRGFVAFCRFAVTKHKQTVVTQQPDAESDGLILSKKRPCQRVNAPVEGGTEGVGIDNGRERSGRVRLIVAEQKRLNMPGAVLTQIKVHGGIRKGGFVANR